MAVFDNGYNGRKVSALQLPLSASAAGLNLSGLSAATGSLVGSGDGIAALKLDLSQLEALGEAPAIGDFLSVLDASVGSGNEMADVHKVATKKMTVQQLGETLANPPSADGDSLGTADLEWSDLYLADGGVIYMGNSQDVTITHDGSAGLGIAHNGAFDLDAGGAMTLDAGSFTVGGDGDTGAIAMDSTAGISLDAADASNFSTSNGTLTIEAGGSDDKLVLKGDHESDVAIHLDGNAAAGSIVDIDAGVLDVDAAGAITMDAGAGMSLDAADDSNVTVAGSGKDLTLSVSGGGAQKLIASSAGTGADAVDIDASAGGITMDAAGAMSLDAADDSNLTVTASGKDLDIAVAGGGTQELRLASAGTGASALHLNASAGSVDIDSADNITMDAADDIALTTTSADGLITLHSAHTAGQAILIDANAAAGSILDVDAGIMDVDVQGAYNLDAGGAIGVTGAGVDVNAGSGTLELTSTGGTVDINGVAIDIDGSGAISIDTSDTSNGVKIGAGTSGMPITLGHATSEVTIGDNLTVTGDLTVSGTTTTLDTTNLLVEDPIIVLNKANSSANGQGGIAIENGGSSADLVFGRVANDTWGVGTKDTSGGTVTTLADMTVTKFRASELEVEGTANKIHLDTDLKMIAAADIVLDPGGNNVIPGSDSADSLGKPAGSSSVASSFGSFLQYSSPVLLSSASTVLKVSAGAASTLASVQSGDSLTISESGNTFTATAAGGYATNAQGPSSFGSFLASTGLTSSTTSISPGGGGWPDSFLHNIATGDTITIGSFTATIASVPSSSSGALGVSGASGSQSEINGGISTSVTGIGVVISSASISGSNFAPTGSASTSFTRTVAAVAWANLYVDAIDLNGQGNISVGGSGRIDLDADDDTSIRASADDVITFEAGASDRMSMSSTMLYPASSDGLALGGTSNMWSDLFLASGGVVNFSAGDVTVTHSSGQLAVSDSLVISDHADSSVGLVLGSTAITATGAELNIMDGDTSDSAVTLVDADQLVVNDGGTMKQSAVTSLAPYLAGDGLSVSSNKLVITSKNESKDHAGSAAQEIALSGKVFDSGNSQASASTFSGSSVTFRILKADRVHSPVAGKQITVGSYTATISSVTTTTVSSSNDAWQVVLGSGSGSSGSATTISFAKDGTFFDLAETPAADSLMVFVNGILQTVSTHYSLSSDKVAMADGNALPDDGSVIEFRYIKG